MRWKQSRPIEGKLISITITRDIDQWYVSVLCEVPDVKPIKQTTEDQVVGIDLGLKVMITEFDFLGDKNWPTGSVREIEVEMTDEEYRNHQEHQAAVDAWKKWSIVMIDRLNHWKAHEWCVVHAGKEQAVYGDWQAVWEDDSLTHHFKFRDLEIAAEFKLRFGTNTHLGSTWDWLLAPDRTPADLLDPDAPVKLL